MTRKLFEILYETIIKCIKDWILRKEYLNDEWISKKKGRMFAKCNELMEHKKQKRMRYTSKVLDRQTLLKQIRLRCKLRIQDLKAISKRELQFGVVVLQTQYEGLANCVPLNDSNHSNLKNQFQKAVAQIIALNKSDQWFILDCKWFGDNFQSYIRVIHVDG